MGIFSVPFSSPGDPRSLIPVGFQRSVGETRPFLPRTTFPPVRVPSSLAVGTGLLQVVLLSKRNFGTTAGWIFFSVPPVPGPYRRPLGGGDLAHLSPFFQWARPGSLLVPEVCAGLFPLFVLSSSIFGRGGTFLPLPWADPSVVRPGAGLEPWSTGLQKPPTLVVLGVFNTAAGPRALLCSPPFKIRCPCVTGLRFNGFLGICLSLFCPDHCSTFLLMSTSPRNFQNCLFFFLPPSFLFFFRSLFFFPFA